MGGGHGDGGGPAAAGVHSHEGDEDEPAVAHMEEGIPWAKYRISVRLVLSLNQL